MFKVGSILSLNSCASRLGVNFYIVTHSFANSKTFTLRMVESETVSRYEDGKMKEYNLPTRRLCRNFNPIKVSLISSVSGKKFLANISNKLIFDKWEGEVLANS